MDTRIYVVTHKEYTKPSDDLFLSLHVGRKLGSDLGYQGDDTGKSISEKNKSFCELTGLYWVWKNVQCDVVGICHYRRYFVKDEDFIKKDYIEKLLKYYDIIVPQSGETEYGSNYEHYKNVHILSDIELCKKVTLEKYPEYEKAFDLFLNTNLASLGNMLITKKTIYDEYCKWLFDILFEVEKRADISSYDDYQGRLFGFLSERLFRIWLFMQKYKVAEEEVRMIDPADSENAVKSVELKQKLIEIILKDITSAYKNKAIFDVVDNSPLEVELGEKTPVWICWWQGIENAPELVKICIESIKRNIPNDKAKIHIIDFNNVGNYIALPTWIIEKFDAELISMAHLSDILRCGLLYRYGGLWIDATYYMEKPLPDYVFEKDMFYTHKMKTPKWRADISKGRWSINLLKTNPGNILFRFLLNGLYEYWDLRDEAIDYFFFDHIFSLAYENIDEVRQMIDECEFSQPHLFELQELLNKKYDRKVFEEITKDTNLFKLTYRNTVYEETLIGKQTFYGAIKEKYSDSI